VQSCGRAGPGIARTGPELAASGSRSWHWYSHSNALVSIRRPQQHVPKLRRCIVKSPKGSGEGPASPASLPKRIREFTETLKREFSHRILRRSKAFKRRVLTLISVNLPPYPKPTGRPRQPHVTEAVNMYAAQCREVGQGALKRVNWRPIAQRCIPGYNSIRSNDTRRVALNRLRDSVYARSRRRTTHHNRKGLQAL
jgi:hypothetical protein